MAKRRGEQRSPLDEEQGVFLVDPDDEDPDELSLMSAAAELGGISNATITIKKIAANRDEEHCFQCAPLDFSIDKIREEWGPGAYRIYGRKDDKIAFNKKLVLAKPLDKPKVEVPAAPALDIQALLRDVTQHFASTQQQMVSEMQKLIILALSNNRAPVIDPIVMQNNLLDQMTKLKTLTGGSGNETSAVEMLLKGFELAKDLSPQTGAETNDVLLKMVEEFGPPLGELVLRGANQDQARPSLPAPLKPKGGNPMLKMLNMLVNAASLDADPATYASMIFDQVAVEQIQGFFSMGNPIEMLGRMDKRVLEYRQWFEELKGLLEEGLKEAALPEHNEPPATEEPTSAIEPGTAKGLPEETSVR